MKRESKEQYKNNKVGDYVTQGNVTEQAILNFFMGVYGGKGCIDKKDEFKNLEECTIEFSSKRKRASCVIKTRSGYRIYTKGAPDMLFDQLVAMVNSDGAIENINDRVFQDPSVNNNQKMNGK